MTEPRWLYVCIPMGKADRRTVAAFDKSDDAVKWCDEHRIDGIDGWDAQWWVPIAVEVNHG